jgi:hypothetical protein
VDREERPDVDRIYMLYVQASSGSGGWPMSVWLTPDLKPFFGGTYFPPDSRYGRPGFSEVLQHIARSWRENRDQVVASSENIAEQLRNYTSGSGRSGRPDASLFESGYSPFRRSFDSQYGGFGAAPKFPRPVVFNYLLRLYAKTKNKEALAMTAQTLQAMAAGGMHDQLGGGFHRYSVDRHWFVPHFEKMLYDQAQLAVSYLEAFQITRDPAFERIARDIFTYVLRDMRHPEGGFYSAEDADSSDPENPSHKAEGAFYVWRQSEIEELLDRQPGFAIGTASALKAMSRRIRTASSRAKTFCTRRLRTKRPPGNIKRPPAKCGQRSIRRGMYSSRPAQEGPDLISTTKS